MTLRQSISDDATAVFLATDEFAETVTYYPYQYPGDDARDSRSIVAVVFRESETTLTEDGDTITPVWEVHVANDSTYGIASDELDTGRDQIELPPRDGETAEKRTIVQIVNQDHGMLILRCQ